MNSNATYHFSLFSALMCLLRLSDELQVSNNTCVPEKAKYM